MLAPAAHAAPEVCPALGAGRRVRDILAPARREEVDRGQLLRLTHHDVKDGWLTLDRSSKARRVTRIASRFHDLRHTCASLPVQAGVPLLTVRDFLGHSTVAVTRRYAHLQPEHLREAVLRLG